MSGGTIDRLWSAQNGRCFHCGQPMLKGVVNHHGHRWSREHLFPRSKYAPVLSACIVLAHRKCNSARGCVHPSSVEITRAKSIYAVAGLPWGPPPTPILVVGYRPLGKIAELWPASAAA